MADLEQWYAELPSIQQLWVDLSRSRWEIEEGDSVLQKLSTAPWESDDPAILQAWDNLTRPENLDDLEAWANQDSMNTTAFDCARRAVEVCRERKQRGDR